MKQPWPQPFPTHTLPQSPRQCYRESQEMPQPCNAVWREGPAAAAALPPGTGRANGCSGIRSCTGATCPHCPGDGDLSGSTGAGWGQLSVGRVGRLGLRAEQGLRARAPAPPQSSCTRGGHSADPPAALPLGPAAHRRCPPRRAQGAPRRPARRRGRRTDGAQAAVRASAVRHSHPSPARNTSVPGRGNRRRPGPQSQQPRPSRHRADAAGDRV